MFIDALKLRNSYGLLSEDVHPVTRRAVGQLSADLFDGGHHPAARSGCRKAGRTAIGAARRRLQSRCDARGKAGGRAGGLEVAVKAALRHRAAACGSAGAARSPRKGEAAETSTVGTTNVDYVVDQTSAREDYRNTTTASPTACCGRCCITASTWPSSRAAISPATCASTSISRSELDKLLRPDDIIWVHDYHLIPLAKAAARRAATQPHRLFPAHPVSAAGGADRAAGHERLMPALVPTTTWSASRPATTHSTSRATSRASAGCTSRDVSLRDRRPRGAGRRLPDRHRDRANSPGRRGARSKSRFVQNMVGSLNGRAHDHRRRPARLLQGPAAAARRVRAFLRNYPDWRGKRHLSADHAAEPQRRSRNTSRCEREVGEGAGRINGTYGEADWTPIRYINRALQPHARSPGSTASPRVGLVTPLRDGMNLVAKEYIAAQDPEDPGVLVLSRFAGAAHECKEALLVNPYDTEAWPPRSIARWRCRWRSGASGTRRCTRCCCTTTSRTGPSASSRRLTRPRARRAGRSGGSGRGGE